MRSSIDLVREEIDELRGKVTKLNKRVAALEVQLKEQPESFVPCDSDGIRGSRESKSIAYHLTNHE